MPKQPNMNQMLQQVQKMQADMMKAQEALASETIEASAGGGMVTVTITGDLQVKDIKIDPEAIDPEDPELLQDMVLAAVNEAIRQAQELAATRMGGAHRRDGPRRAGRPAGPGLLTARLYAPPIHRLITELGKLPGVGARTAQRLALHILRASPQDAAALAESIREVKERIGLCEVCFNFADGPRCRICSDERRDAG